MNGPERESEAATRSKSTNVNSSSRQGKALVIFVLKSFGKVFLYKCERSLLYARVCTFGRFAVHALMSVRVS